jgi:hypothetical protein
VTSIKIGSESKTAYVSEQKEKFIPKAWSALQHDPNRAKELRKHHFTLEETSKPNYFVTVKNIDFNNKGNPNEIRSFIPAEVKENQRASHFTVGFDKNFRPGSAAIPPQASQPAY